METEESCFGIVVGVWGNIHSYLLTVELFRNWSLLWDFISAHSFPQADPGYDTDTSGKMFPGEKWLDISYIRIQGAELVLHRLSLNSSFCIRSTPWQFHPSNVCMGNLWLYVCVGIVSVRVNDQYYAILWEWGGIMSSVILTQNFKPVWPFQPDATGLWHSNAFPSSRDKIHGITSIKTVLQRLFFKESACFNRDALHSMWQMFVHMSCNNNSSYQLTHSTAFPRLNHHVYFLDYGSEEFIITHRIS